VDWEIQVETESPNTLWGSLNAGKAARRFFRFGTWSRRRGLWRVPVNPMLNVGEMIEESDALIAALQEKPRSGPLPPRRPLRALAAGQTVPSARSARDDGRAGRIGDLRPQPWQAAPLPEHGFRSPVLDGEPALPARRRTRVATRRPSRR